MIYRALGKTGLSVSEVGFGCEHLQGMDYNSIKDIIDLVLEKGINIFDIFMSEPEVRSNIGKALQGRRDKVILQGHIGAVWQEGQYTRSRNLDDCKYYFQDFMTRIQTDYVDIGMIHYIDSDEDFNNIFSGDIIKYAVELKEKGIIKALGISSHNPVVATKAVETGLIDVLMFSINPVYDVLPEDTDIDGLFSPDTYKTDSLNGINNVRDRLYKTCESMGVGITVMKSLAAGALLRAETSPFGEALTVVQCINYALTRPAVVSVLVGCKTTEEVNKAYGYETATKEEKDYAAVLSKAPKYSLKGKCMYCNHCLPCPSKIDIAQVNKYLDLAVMSEPVPETVREHYKLLENHASDCIECGSCESNCPFSVKIIDKMRLATDVFKL